MPSSIQPTAFAAAGQTVGVPRVPRALERRQSELALYGAGKVSTDPRVLANTVRGRERFAQTLERRQQLYDTGAPLVEGAPLPERGFILVRNPEALPTKVADEVRAALRDPDRFTDEGSLAVWKAEWMRPAKDGLPGEWARDLANVRLVPEAAARGLIDDAFKSGPRAHAAAIAGLLNSTVRATVLYVPLLGARYVARNMAQNVLLLALTKPQAYVRLPQVANLRRVDADLWDAIKVEAGTVRAAAGLPERLRGATRLQATERGFTNWSRRFANRLGDIADEPFRVAAWLQYAREYGFKDKAAWRQLLDSDDPNIVRVRNDIAQRVRDDMIDFDAISPAERETIARFAFIYAFKRGAVKWPAMYLREYPTRTAILSLVAAQHEREMNLMGIPQTAREIGRTLIGGREFDWSWLTPWDPAHSDVESALALGRGIAQGDRVSLEAAGELLSPQYRELGAALFGRGGTDLEGVARITVPGYADLQRAERGGSPWDHLLRSLGAAVEVPEFRKQERAESHAKIDAAFTLVGPTRGQSQEEVAQSQNAYHAYKDAEARAEFAASDLGRELSDREKAMLLTAVAENYHPELRDQLPTPEQLQQANGFEKYVDQLRKLMFAPRERLLARASGKRSRELAATG